MQNRRDVVEEVLHGEGRSGPLMAGGPPLTGWRRPDTPLTAGTPLASGVPGVHLGLPASVYPVHDLVSVIT